MFAKCYQNTTRNRLHCLHVLHILKTSISIDLCGFSRDRTIYAVFRGISRVQCAVFHGISRVQCSMEFLDVISFNKKHD